MIFPKIKADKIVQVGDLIRLDATFSIVEEPDLVEIQPDALEARVDVTNLDKRKWLLDYVYSSEGDKAAKVIITKDAIEYEKEINILVVTEEEDNLFSTDNDLTASEPDILRYLPRGKSSFNYAHREAQRRIMAYLDEQRIWKADQTRYSKDDIADIFEFSEWSRYLTLHIIFQQLQVTAGDIFEQRAETYKDLATNAARRSSLRLGGANDTPSRVVDRLHSIRVLR
jgi:hypothetical protein